MTEVSSTGNLKIAVDRLIERELFTKSEVKDAASYVAPHLASTLDAHTLTSIIRSICDAKLDGVTVGSHRQRKAA